MKLDFSKQIGKKIAVFEKGRTIFVDVETITYLQCDGYITIIYLSSNESYSVSKLLKLFELELSEYGFLRANHNTIVNPKNISTICSTGCKKIIQTHNHEIKVSRRKAYLFKELLKGSNNK